MKTSLGSVPLFLLLLSGSSIAIPQTDSTENAFNQATLTTLSVSLQQDIEKGNLEWAELHGIQLQLALMGSISGDSSKVSSSTSLTVGTSDSEALRAKFLDMLKRSPLKILDEDPTASAALVPMAAQLQRKIEEADLSGSQADLGNLLTVIAKLHQRQLRVHIQADLNKASQYDDEKNYLRRSIKLADSLQAQSLSSAEALAPEILAEAPAFRIASGLYGANIYNAYDALGRGAFQRGDFQGAAQYLAEAGKSPGSPALDTFGPNLWLAKSLLDHGYSDAVIMFLDSCKSFWKKPDIDKWIAEIKSGHSPNFLPNSKPEF